MGTSFLSIAAVLKIVDYRKENKIEETRATYKSINYKVLDWPEAVLNSWILFEHLYGSASDIQECVDTVQKIQIAIDLKRAKVTSRLFLG